MWLFSVQAPLICTCVCIFICVYVHIYFIYTLTKGNNVLFLNEQLNVVCYVCDDDEAATEQTSSAENFNHQKQRGGRRKLENTVRRRKQ